MICSSKNHFLKTYTLRSLSGHASQFTTPAVECCDQATSITLSRDAVPPGLIRPRNRPPLHQQILQPCPFRQISSNRLGNFSHRRCSSEEACPIWQLHRTHLMRALLPQRAISILSTTCIRELWMTFHHEHRFQALPYSLTSSKPTIPPPSTTGATQAPRFLDTPCRSQTPSQHHLLLLRTSQPPNLRGALPSLPATAATTASTPPSALSPTSSSTVIAGATTSSPPPTRLPLLLSVPLPNSQPPLLLSSTSAPSTCSPSRPIPRPQKSCSRPLRPHHLRLFLSSAARTAETMLLLPLPLRNDRRRRYRSCATSSSSARPKSARRCFTVRAGTMCQRDGGQRWGRSGD